MKHLLILIGVVILFISCKGTDRALYTKTIKSSMPFDKEWQDTLKQNVAQAKNAWFEIIDRNFNYPKERFGLTMTQNDFENLELVPSAHYTIDSSSFADMNTNSKVKDMITLSRNTVNYYGFRGKEFIIDMKLIFNEGWKFHSWTGQTSKLFGKKLTELYFDKKNYFFDITVNYCPSKNYFKNDVVFINERGDIMSLDAFGVTRLYKDVLLKLNIQSGEERN